LFLQDTIKTSTKRFPSGLSLPLEKLTFRKVDTSRNDNVFIASEGLIHLYISATQNFLITVVGGFAILNNTRARITLTSTEVLSILYNHIKSMLRETRLINQEWTYFSNGSG
jgi:hypothetical protein